MNLSVGMFSTFIYLIFYLQSLYVIFDQIKVLFRQSTLISLKSTFIFQPSKKAISHFSPENSYKGLNKIHPDNTRNNSLGVCWFTAPQGIADVVSGSKKGPGGVGCQSHVCFFSP